MDAGHPVVVENGEERGDLHSTSLMEYLANKKEGIYTTARTVGQTSILEWGIHLQRIAMLQGIRLKEASEESLIDYVSSQVLPSIRLAMSLFRERLPNHEGEMKIVVHATLAKDAPHPVEAVFSPIHILVQVQQLPAPPKWPAIVQIRKAGPRSNATVKSVEWVSARKVFESQMTQDVNEAILADSQGLLYEGLSSNFFAILPLDDEQEKTREETTAIHYKLQTAPDEAVLGGSIRSLVLQACRKRNIPVEMVTPSARDCMKWKAAFVTSTSRMVLPIGSVRLLDEEGSPEVRLVEIPPLLYDLSRWVLEELKGNATPILL